jgi:hypothetical protein
VGWQSRLPVTIADARRQRRLRAWADRKLARRSSRGVYRLGVRLGVGLIVAIGILALISSGVFDGLRDRIEPALTSGHDRPASAGSRRAAERRPRPLRLFLPSSAFRAFAFSFPLFGGPLHLGAGPEMTPVVDGGLRARTVVLIRHLRR